MKPLSVLVILVLLLGFAVPVQAAAPAWVIPTTQIISVVTDTSVTLKTANFPASDSFDVYMNTYGTRGVGGVKVDTINSGAGGTLELTFTIPDSLKGLQRIAIRLQSPTSGYYAYDWFWNNTSASAPATPSAPSGTDPAIWVTSVIKGEDVTIKTANFPENVAFNVLFVKYGASWADGIQTTSVNSGSGGELTFTFDIPDYLSSQERIAIRLTDDNINVDTWFWNKTGDVAAPPSDSGATPRLPAGVIPTFSISAVVRDESVTISTANFPAGDTFDVYMGVYGSKGIGGVKVGTLESGSGGALTATFSVPDNLKGLQRIAIRTQSPTSGYYSFNWFWNNTYP